ncbi:MAG TPA: HTTM domain-containing protein, partial [Bacteroidia bacterium]
MLKPAHLAPLAIFRMAFGVLMLASVIRFLLKGWVYQMYVKPQVFFPYYGFEWVKPLGETGMYVLFGIMALSALFIALGFFYRASALSFFLTFTYVELIDKTNYLNHYYFISIAAFILIFLPAHRYFSLDVWRKKELAATHAPNYFLFAIKLQVFIVYFFAGIAKINYDWLVEAQPLRIWLPAHSEMPVIGSLLTKEWVAYFFSWFGCLYDLIIPFLLFNPRFIRPAYFLVIVFHLATSLLFNIGMFPYIMIALTCIFFSEQFHITLIERLRSILRSSQRVSITKEYRPSVLTLKVLSILFVAHFSIQLLMPFRYLLYPGNLYWTEQGYRFSWRV